VVQSETEARIRRLHARIAGAEQRVDGLDDRTGRLVQNLAGFNQVGATFGGCETTIKGRISGFDSTFSPLEDSTVQFTGSTTGTDYGTYAVPTGDFEIPLSVEFADSQLQLRVAGPAPWFAPSAPYAINLFPRCGVGTYGVSGLGNTFQSGWNAASYKLMTNPSQSGGWVEFDSQYPLSYTLNYDHSLWGTGTIATGGQGIHLGPCVDYAFPGFTYPGSPTSCAAVGTALTVNLYHQGQFVLGSRHGGLGICPVAGFCGDGLGFQLAFVNVVNVSKQYTNAPLGLKYDWTFKIAADTNAWHGHSDQFLRIWEP
jgi:hypothetical protein